MKKPLCIDLFCGLGGWAEGFLSEGWDVVGFDIKKHDYGSGTYPGKLVLQDVLTLDGSQFRAARCIVASPPCQEFSYHYRFPWKARDPDPGIRLFYKCLAIREQSGVPMIIENVVGAQKWIGKARCHFGPFYLWGDVPALMPDSYGVHKGFGQDFESTPWARYGSKDPRRKAASARIAKIPFELSSYIARVYNP